MGTCISRRQGLACWHTCRAEAAGHICFCLCFHCLRTASSEEVWSSVLLLHILHLREEWTAFIIYSIEHCWVHLDQQARDSRLLRNERTVSSNLFLPSPRNFALFFGSIFQLQPLMAHTVHTLEPGRGVGSFKLLREDGVGEKRSLPDPAVSSVELSSGHISVMFCSFFPLWLMFPPDVGVSRQHKAGQIWVV